MADTTVVPITPAVAEAIDEAAPPARGPDGHHPFRLKDVRVGNKDGRGVPVTYIYATADEYSIYHAGEVIIQFSDDTGRAQVQRKSILPVNSIRAEVNTLIQGLPCRRIYDRQLAYAMQLALDGDPDSAKATIAATKISVLAKRAARGRCQYLKWSSGVTLLLLVLMVTISLLLPVHDRDPMIENLLIAGTAGLVGAAFSIALAIRNRTVALDLDPSDNAIDGILRLLIGVISAGILFLLFGNGILPALKIGDAGLDAATLTSWQKVLVVGFLGGFLERLVPDLLENKNSLGRGGNVSAAAASATA